MQETVVRLSFCLHVHLSVRLSALLVFECVYPFFPDVINEDRGKTYKSSTLSIW